MSDSPREKPRSWEIGPCDYCGRITDSPEVSLTGGPDKLLCDNCGEPIQMFRVVPRAEFLESIVEALEKRGGELILASTPVGDRGPAFKEAADFIREEFS